jgi:hypothetical protein
MPVMPIEITTPQTTPAPYNLLDTISAERLPEHGGMAGVTYETDFCGVARAWVNPCADPGVLEKVADDGINYTDGEPIPLYHLSSCRLVGSEDREARALRALDLGASRALETGFASVIGAAATNITGGTAHTVRVALARLEQFAGENYGGRPVIHMTRHMATLAASVSLIRIVGDHLETYLGSLVIAGAGYADAQQPVAPVAGSNWMYATGEVHVWEGQTLTTPVVLNQPYDNEYYVLAERVYVPTFECFAAAVETSLEIA